jgi:hypothetical protein
MGIVSDIIARLTGRDPNAAPSPDDLVLLVRPESEPEARMWQELLENRGIRSVIKNRDGFTAAYNIPGPSWAYELWVLRRDRDEATEILGLTPALEDA